ncbi:MAG: NUDIX hydrolase [Lachnospiraceae bacterium]|jgi:ADP-ribose pyrophosphatase|nr:NUDIX hydrolase [Lachnospiraceae bacterium]MCI1397937.1 NUDIX hydrolase [Lachnospiraceae bacterium]MCI1424017.1 NUDIX hydrolase [Lachnospiraceae bacterium]MCI1452816.1 NUDIX hydrolase [Lachnospiraceae bacterium]
MIDQKAWNKEERELAWRALETRHLVQDAWIDFREQTFAFPDGTSFGPYYNYSRRNYAVILASDEEGRFLCVRQYRHGLRQVTCEFPAGGIEEEIADPMSEAGEKTALAAAMRELSEETGYETNDWSHLLTVPSAATMADNWAFLFRAKNCQKTAEPHLDATEFLKQELLLPEDIDALIAEGRFQQAIHCMGWFLTERGRR